MPIFKGGDVLNVKIGYRNYGLKFEDAIYTDEPKELYGEIKYDDEVIRISKKFSLKQQAATILHEVLHGIDEDREIDLTEKQVSQISIGLFDVMAKNSQLFKETIIGLGED